MRAPLVFVVALLFASAAVAAPQESKLDPAGVAFFEKKIRPLLVEHCLICHSTEAKKSKGGLLLDSREATLEGGETGPAVVPGKPGESLLIKAVKYHTESLQMPPKGKLSDAAIADLEKWVAMGAPDPRKTAAPAKKTAEINLDEARKFWAFQSPKQHPVPAVKDSAWARSDIDRFLLAKLEEKGLKPAGDADPVTLIRRVHFDLIGLPPTSQEIDEFLKSYGAKPRAALEEVVDKLLKSPAFGERWGRHWLDVARYAESSGGGRSLLFKDAWRYRDYVIDSFNNDKPFDRFIREQVAGDLLPFTSPEQRQQQVTGTAFLVLGPTNYEEQDKTVLEMDVIDEQIDTIGRTFLGLTIGCARCHDHKFDPIPTKDYYALAGIFRNTQTLIHDNVSKWVELPLPAPPDQEKLIREHEALVAKLKAEIAQAKATEKKSGKVVAGPKAEGVISPKDLPGIVLDDTQAKKVGMWTVSKYGNAYIGEGALYDDRSTKAERTLTFVPEFPKAGKYEVRLAYVANQNRSDKVPVHILHLDGETTVHVNMKENPPIDGRFVSLGTFRFNTNGQWFVLISNEGTTGHISVDAVQFLPEEMRNAELGIRNEKPEPKATVARDSKALEAELKKLNEKAPERPVAMSVKEAAKIDDFYVCIRGNVHTKGPKVPRGFLQVLSHAKPAVTAKESGRRELAEWLASADNPLTARVMANRIWHHLFGAGIVRTVDEFGKTGEMPSHPELLDYLALQFVREGWSTKKLIREILLTRAYQMSSIPHSEFRIPNSVDPENRLLWKQNRKRLTAEALRDTMLQVSGQLDRTAGGPTMKAGTTNEYGYVFNDTRRSVYTPVLRNKLPELFEVFDFPDPNIVTGRRTASTIATQALFMMNSPFAMDQAKATAQKLLATADLDDAGRLERIYRSALNRSPTDNEKSAALAFVAGKNKPEERLAAWSHLCQALFACIDFRYVN